MDIFVILLIGIWVVLAIRSMKKKKHGCSGNCFSCLTAKNDIHAQFRKDHPLK